MLDTKLIRKVEDFVYPKPRTIQEISQHIGKSWRTADRYVSEIENEHGTLSTRTFREGTRGALKIVYWSSTEKISNSVFQEKLAKEIETFKRKEDFSAFDIFQYIPDKNKKVNIYKVTEESKTDLKVLADLLNNTKKQFIGFSGNLSWLNLKNKDINIFECIENLVKKNIPIKIVSRVEIGSIDNIKKLLELNFKYGKELIEIRHHEQPLRAFVYDNKIASVKEIKEPTGKVHELNQRLVIIYTIKDKDWVEWLSKIFWKMFYNSIDANKRIEELKKFNA